jgi:hypothetical protein
MKVVYSNLSLYPAAFDLLPAPRAVLNRGDAWNDTPARLGVQRLDVDLATGRSGMVLQAEPNQHAPLAAHLGTTEFDRADVLLNRQRAGMLVAWKSLVEHAHRKLLLSGTLLHWDHSREWKDLTVRCCLSVRPKDWLDSKLALRLDDYTDVVTEELTQNLVGHRRVRPTADVIAEFRLHHVYRSVGKILAGKYREVLYYPVWNLSNFGATAVNVVGTSGCRVIRHRSRVFVRSAKIRTGIARVGMPRRNRKQRRTSLPRQDRESLPNVRTRLRSNIHWSEGSRERTEATREKVSRGAG